MDGHVISSKAIYLILTNPIHCPTHGQWWSNFWMQLLQIEQWEARGGRYSKQVSQNFTLTECPLTIKSFVRGNFTSLLLIHSIDGVFKSTDSSNSGGWAFLGIIPGSLPDVMKRKVKSCINLSVRVCQSMQTPLKPRKFTNSSNINIPKL